MNEAIAAVFEALQLPEITRAVLHRLSANLFARTRYVVSPSGVVIAGFGELDMVPSLAEFTISGVTLGKLRFLPGRTHSALMGPSIMPFAQSEMVETFMEGVNPNFRKVVGTFLEKVLGDLPDALMTALASHLATLDEPARAELKAKLGAACSVINNQLGARVKEYTLGQHVRPIIGAGSLALPKEQLAEMAEALQKPVVVYMGSLAASGGYYVACGGSSLMAHETTLTGSIGVIMQTINYEQLIGKVGVSSVTFKSGPFKDMMSGSRQMTDAEREYVQGMVMQTYDKFVGIVARERQLDEGALRTGLADGRVISGKDAMEAKLINSLGEIEDAYAKAMELAKIKSATIIRYDSPFKLGKLFRLLGQGESSAKTTVEVKIADALMPKLEAGRLYFCRPFTRRKSCRPTNSNSLGRPRWRCSSRSSLPFGIVVYLRLVARLATRRRPGEDGRPSILPDLLVSFVLAQRLRRAGVHGRAAAAPKIAARASRIKCCKAASSSSSSPSAMLAFPSLARGLRPGDAFRAPPRSARCERSAGRCCSCRARSLCHAGESHHCALLKEDAVRQPLVEFFRNAAEREDYARDGQRRRWRRSRRAGLRRVPFSRLFLRRGKALRRRRGPAARLTALLFAAYPRQSRLAARPLRARRRPHARLRGHRLAARADRHARALQRHQPRRALRARQRHARSP